MIFFHDYDDNFTCVNYNTFIIITVEDETKLVDPVIPNEASEPVQAVIEEGHEVIIPPGTEEPLLPITKVTSEKEINNSDTITTKKDDYEETFEDDRRPRERPRVFNKDPQRDRFVLVYLII